MGLLFSRKAAEPHDAAVREATEADREWLCRHWAPHMSRLPQLAYESQKYAKGPVHYAAASQVVGIVDAYSMDQSGHVSLVATHPRTLSPVRVSFDALKTWINSIGHTNDVASRDIPRHAGVSMKFDLQFTDGSSTHFRGFTQA